MPRSNPNQNALPGRFPVYRMLAFVLACSASVLTFQAWRSAAGPLRSFYLLRYVRLSVLPAPRLDYRIQRSPSRAAQTFEILVAGNTVVTTANLPYLSGPLTLRDFQMEPKAFALWLEQNVYDGRTVTQALHGPLYLTETYFPVFFLLGWILDRRRVRTARSGLILRGPGLVSRWRFNRKTRGDGLAFQLTNRRNLLEFLSGADGCLRIPRNKEAHHIQIAGDTGSGKSTLIRQIIRQIAERGEGAIIFDPDREYIQEFFDESRGDWVLNPLDERCPYWELEGEALTEAEATSIGLSAYPDEPNQQPFFKKHPRAIFAYLIWRYNRYNCPEDPATCESLARWLSDPRQFITPRLEGTRHAVSTDANAKDQSQGLWANVGEIATPLGMMPPFDEGRREWTVRDWADHRQGWIFITSTPDTLEALRPLQSLWLDMLILKLQLPSRSGQRVWMIFDELAALNQLPQLHSALTRQRKYDNPIVLGFQSMSQLIKAYGENDARTIMSQAFTNMILRTREFKSAEHLSGLIGKAQLERLRESQSSQLMAARQGNYNTERVIEPVVMDSEIQILEDLTGYFVQKDSIVPFTFEPMPRQKVAPDFIERTIEPQPFSVPKRAAVSTGVVSSSSNKAKDIVFADH